MADCRPPPTSWATTCTKHLNFLKPNLTTLLCRKVAFSFQASLQSHNFPNLYNWGQSWAGCSVGNEWLQLLALIWKLSLHQFVFFCYFYFLKFSCKKEEEKRIIFKWQPVVPILKVSLHQVSSDSSHWAQTGQTVQLLAARSEKDRIVSLLITKPICLLTSKTSW